MNIELYTECRKPQWDRFVAGSKNGTFLFLRDYMDHHNERFADYSLMIREDDVLVALLPATAARDGYLSSHAGLTYGGFITDASMKTPRMLRMFDATLTWLREQGFHGVLYKPVPHIYHRAPAEEDRYPLMRCGARWVRSGLLAVADSENRLPFQERRKRAIQKAKKQQLRVAESDDVEIFWEILSSMLERVYSVKPVHTLAEMRCLMRAFPDNIRLFGCFEDAAMVAGVVVFETARVARAQYIASSDRGKDIGALDLTLDFLLGTVYREKRYFDFGTSEENGCINQGLIEQKEGFGARAIAMDQYFVDLDAWEPGMLAGCLL